MDLHELGLFTVRWLHVLFGIVWIGMLYYFNFVQGEYFKEATPEAKGDAVKKLAPRALWWFRWGAAFTFLTGAVLFAGLMKVQNIDLYIAFSALMGTFMAANVWFVIWPAQKIVCGIVEGDAAAAGPKALLASRTNTLFSIPMLFGMLASQHLGGDGAALLATNMSMSALGASLVLVAALEANALFGKLGPMASVKGVIHCGVVLTVVIVAIVNVM